MQARLDQALQQQSQGTAIFGTPASAAEEAPSLAPRDTAGEEAGDEQDHRSRRRNQPFDQNASDLLLSHLRLTGERTIEKERKAKENMGHRC